MSKLWGTRFNGNSTDQLADQFSFSIDYDQRLARYDCLVSLAHARMLGDCQIIPKSEARLLIDGLKALLKDMNDQTFQYNPSEEDIHTDIQNQLKQRIGDAADRLHTARSRNDLIVTDMKLYCREQTQIILAMIRDLQRALLQLAERNQTLLMPAYTHLQGAQVVSVSHYLLSFIELLDRDHSRFEDTLARHDTLPLGSCALSGSTLATNRQQMADELGFTRPAENSMDAVSARDFIFDMMSALAILGTHFSRMAEDLILWASGEFDFVHIDWTLCTGSSIMPHKKNPDILELIRGESATLIANLNRVLILLKGTPFCYNRDFQLDKPPLFESVDKILLMTPLLVKTYETLVFDEARLKTRANDETLFSVDVMEYMIRKGMSYREAHDTVGRLVRGCLDKGRSLKDLSVEEWQSYSDLFAADIKDFLNAETSVRMKQSFGSTGPDSVTHQIKRWNTALNNK